MPAALWASQKGLTLQELAKSFNRDGNSLSRLAQSFSQRHACNENLQNQYRQFEETVLNFADMQA